jgi:tRNA(Ile)-lysidine synthase
VAVRLAGAGSVVALHANYGLRPEANAEEEHCATLARALGVELVVERPHRPARARNLQAWARDSRYGAAARLALRRDARVATGHTATDQAETVLYRLAASPGRRALLGMPARDGRLVRPLLRYTREDTAAYCRARGLTWRDDPSNDDADRFARAAVRHGLVPALRAIHPAAEANVLRTTELLRDEAEVLDALVDDALAGADSIEVARLAALPPALRRLVARRLAEAAATKSAPAGDLDDPAALAGGMRPASTFAPADGLRPASGFARADGLRQGSSFAPTAAARVDEVCALGPGGGALDLGGGLRAVVEQGRLRFAFGPPAEAPAAVALPVPGHVRFGEWEVRCEAAAPQAAAGVVDAAALGGAATVRAWRPGDRMAPLGLGGTRALQDLFTDRRVPRERRRSLPMVVAGGEIAWVPGVATGERFRITAATRAAVRLTAAPVA